MRKSPRCCDTDERDRVKQQQEREGSLVSAQLGPRNLESWVYLCPQPWGLWVEGLVSEELSFMKALAQRVRRRLCTSDFGYCVSMLSSCDFRGQEKPNRKVHLWSPYAKPCHSELLPSLGA